MIRLAWYHLSSYLQRGFFKNFASKASAGMKKSEDKNLIAGDYGCQIYLCFQLLPYQNVWGL